MFRLVGGGDKRQPLAYPFAMTAAGDRTIVASIEAEYRRYQRLGEQALAQLEAADLTRRAPGDGNSVAILVWHVSGNLASRFTDFLATDGEKPWRDRESEFASRDVSPAEVMKKWSEGWAVLFRSLAELADAELPRLVTIRGQELSVLDALHRSLAHASYHVGQVVMLARAWRGEGWRFLTIPPGKSDDYNRNPTREKGPPA